MQRRDRGSAVLAAVVSLLAVPAASIADQGQAPGPPPGRANKVSAPVAAKPMTSPGDLLLGEWWTENNEGRIRFTKDVDGTFRGTTTCCVPRKVTEDHPARDIHNPNPKLRGRSTLGIVLIWKLVYEDGEYTGGYVYNPRDGKTYRFKAKIIDQNTVKIRGYLAIPLLGQSQIWKRARSEAPAQ